MKIKISRHIRKYIIVYLALILALYLVIEMVPRVTNIFETTEILEPGNLVLETEATGYLIKTESIVISPDQGKIEYLVKDNTAVAKNRKVVSIKETGGAEDEEEAQEGSHKYEDLMEGMKGYHGIYEQKRAPVSGIFSLHMDGSEQAMNPAHMDDLTYEKVQDLPMSQKDLVDSTVRVGDPIYKMTDDNRWYVVCWLEPEAAKNYEEGQTVKLKLPAGTVTATVKTVNKEKERIRLIFTTDMYYKDLATTREVDMTIQGSEQTGLLVSNDCIIEKDGHEGVFVRNKNGDYFFVRVNVIETDGRDSVVSESSYIDAEGQAVTTVSVYDEVLKNPEKALEKEQE